MTTTLRHSTNGTFSHHRRSRATQVDTVRTRSISLGMVGFVALVVSAWAGAIPYVGPIFGFSADGSPSWEWSLSHTVLALIPGAIGCLFALSLMGRTGARVALDRTALVFGGFAAICAGAWFVIGPSAWPVLVANGQYFVTASPLRELAYQSGYSFGPGIILAASGAFAIGWATRHNAPLGVDAVGAVRPAGSKDGAARCGAKRADTNFKSR